MFVTNTKKDVAKFNTESTIRIKPSMILLLFQILVFSKFSLQTPITETALL